MTPAWGLGLATVSAHGVVLDTWFRELGLGEALYPGVTDQYLHAERHDEVRNVHIRAAAIVIDVDAAPASASDAYLRLHLLSHRLVQPRRINLEGRQRGLDEPRAGARR
ncbi:MAG: dapD [Acidimicrobiaceae bacterium]|nr:MAG: dapD [Acidimicrobiaceae bacterium]